MFKWIKTRGCNCCPIPEGHERYILNVGDLYGGEVKYDPDRFGWESSYKVCGETVSGQAGGGNGRDYNMLWIENRILEALRELKSAMDDPHREIYDCLYQANPKTGELEQPRLS